MSDQNCDDGYATYLTGDDETRSWLESQWRRWPDRVHPERTTNLSFHFGAVRGFREVHGRDPEMSSQLKSNVAYLDQDHSS